MEISVQYWTEDNEGLQEMLQTEIINGDTVSAVWNHMRDQFIYELKECSLITSGNDLTQIRLHMGAHMEFEESNTVLKNRSYDNLLQKNQQKIIAIFEETIRRNEVLSVGASEHWKDFTNSY